MPQRWGDKGTRGQGDKGTRCFSSCLFVFLSLSLSLRLSVAGQIISFETRAISSAQEMSASDLDAALTNRPFAGWFSEVIGPKAGVVWQLAECGDPLAVSGEVGQDLPACAEVIASLPSGRKVFVAISVGTFKKGLTGKPSFFSAVIVQNERLYQVRRLSELPRWLRAPDLPAIKMDSALVPTPFLYLRPMVASVPPVTKDLGLVEEPSAPPPPPPPPSTSSTQDYEQVPESDLQNRVITEVRPEYPPTAKKMKATGTVEVEITISEAGLVIQAKAISGHLALRSAAVEAARNWIFKPAKLNGKPVKVKSVLTFVFVPSA